MQRRFSLRQMFEVVTVGALVLTAGKIAEIYGNKIPPDMNPWSLIVLAGGFSDAWLGVRWFADREVADCGLKSLVVGTVLTGVALLPLYLNTVIFAIRPAWLAQWDPLGELKLGVAVAAVGGMLASLLSLLPAAFVKLKANRAA